MNHFSENRNALAYIFLPKPWMLLEGGLLNLIYLMHDYTPSGKEVLRVQM